MAEGTQHWFVAELRATFFCVGRSDPLNPVPLLEALCGLPLEEERKLHGPAPMLEARALGDRWRYGVRSWLSRIDVVQSAEYDPMTDTSKYRELAPAATVLTRFVDGAKRLLPLFDGDVVVRVALAENTRRSADDSAAAVRILKERVPGLPVEEADEEVLFRCNRPTTVTHGDLHLPLNRLRTWRVQRFSQFALAGQPLERAERYATELETDVNTDQRRSEVFSSEQLSWIMDQLAACTLAMQPGGGT